MLVHNIVTNNTFELQSTKHWLNLYLYTLFDICTIYIVHVNQIDFKNFNTVSGCVEFISKEYDIWNNK